MFQAGRLSLIASSIMVGGVALGVALASFARPVPVAPPPAPWEAALHPAIHAGESYGYYSSPPEEVNIPDRYAPAIATSQLRWWPADLRLPREASYVPPPQPVQAMVQYAPDTALDSNQEVQVPHYEAIEQSGRQAQQAAQEAVTMQQAEPSAPVETGNAKVIHVADELAQTG